MCYPLMKSCVIHHWATALPKAPLKQLSLPIRHLEDSVVLMRQSC